MAVNVFPAPSTGPEVPQGLRPPKITYSNQNWSLNALTDIANLIGTGMAMTYRPTDNCLYFTGTNGSRLWKFDLTTKTGSLVNSSFNNRADIVAAQDGTLYAAENLMSGGNTATYTRSTDGGVTWTTMGNSNTIDQGYLTIIDNGYFPGITGNVIFTSRGTSGATLSSYAVVNNSNTNQLVTWNSDGEFGIQGGVCLFPVRDGDDSPASAERFAVSDANTSTTANHISNQSGSLNYKYASLGRWRSVSPANNRIAVNVGSTPYVLSTYNRPMISSSSNGKPTTIQNRWLFGVSRATTSLSPAAFYISDYENNFSIVGGGALSVDSINTTNIGVAPSSFSNPIYIAATKKIYVMYAGFSGGFGDARMYEYNVTTY
jgi:hypothetical protein